MKSIQRRLMAGVFCGALALLLGGGTALWWRTRAVLQTEFDTASRAKALALVSLTKQQDGHVELDFAPGSVPEFARRKRPEYFQIWLADGTTLERSASLAGNDLPQRAGTIAQPAVWDLSLPDGRPGRALAIQFTPQLDEEDGPGETDESTAGVPASSVTLVLARDRASLDRVLAGFEGTLAVVGLLFVAGTAVMVALVVRRGLRPLAGLAAQAAGIDAGSLQRRFPTATMPAELRPICERLNDLLGRLEAAFQRERRVTADIAHELRTPIAELRALTEVALQWPEDANATTRTVQDALEIAQHMEQIVTALLALARCEAGQQTVARQPVALAELLDVTWQPLAVVADRKRLTVERHLPADLHLRTDPTLLRSLLRNLLSNAVEYTPAGGCIEIHGSASDAGFQLALTNSNDNLSAEDVAHLFEPFWRKDAARADSSHCGLGLTVAAALAHALGLELRATLPRPGEVCLTLSGIDICDVSQLQEAEVPV